MAEIEPDKDLKFLTTEELARITNVLSELEATGFNNIEPKVIKPDEIIESEENIENIMEQVAQYNRQLRDGILLARLKIQTSSAVFANFSKFRRICEI